MSVGASRGMTFLFGQEQPSLNAYNTQAQAEQIPFDDMVGETLDQLEQVEGMTDEYYAQWAKAKSFAKMAWQNYGIDVTSPDVDSPDQMNLHNMYLKSVANVRSMGNALKRGAQMEDRGLVAMTGQGGENIYDRGKQEWQPTTSDRFINTGLTEQDKAIINRVNTSTNTMQERDALNLERNKYLEGLMEELKATANPNERKQLMERIRGVKNIKASYDPTQNLNRAQRDRQHKDAMNKVNPPVSVSNYWVALKEESDEVIDMINNSRLYGNAEIVSDRDESGKVVRKLKYYTYNQGEKSNEPTYINLDDDQMGWNSFKNMLGQLDQFDKLDMEEGLSPEQIFKSTYEDDQEASDYMASTLKEAGSFWSFTRRPSKKQKEFNSVLNELKTLRVPKDITMETWVAAEPGSKYIKLENPTIDRDFNNNPVIRAKVSSTFNKDGDMLEIPISDANIRKLVSGNLSTIKKAMKKVNPDKWGDLKTESRYQKRKRELEEERSRLGGAQNQSGLNIAPPTMAQDSTVPQQVPIIESTGTKNIDW